MTNRTDKVTPKARSLRKELSLALVAGIAILWLFGIGGAMLLFRLELTELFDTTLQHTAETILPLAEAIIADGAVVSDNSIPPGLSNEDSIEFVVRNSDGTIVLKSPLADVTAFPQRAATGFSETDHLRVFAVTNDANTLTILAAQPLSERREVLRDTFVALLVPLLILLPAVVAATAYLISRSLRPVDLLSNAVQARGRIDLSPLAVVQLPAELLPTQDAINLLLERLSRALEAERSFTADAAHELRTPIAATMAQTQLLIAKLPPGDIRRRGKAIEVALKRLSHLSEKLLQLARAEGGGVLAAKPQDLAPFLVMVIDDFRRTDQAFRLRISLPHQGTAPSPMDPDAFAILARNLIENALTHGDASAPIDIVLLPDTTLIVTNGGTVVAPDKMARLTQRFERANSRRIGAGLGLAIADEIARGAGQRLDLTSPAPGRKDGFEARLCPAI
jgi:two-component system OmpR family sensor kinase